MSNPPAEHAGSRPVRRDAQRNRARVLAAARSVFAEHGLRASLDDVARQASVGVATVYRNFADKEALAEALFETSIGDIIDIAHQALERPSGWQALEHFLHHVAAAQAGDRGLREIALSTGYGRSRVAALREQVAAQVTEIIERASAEGTLRAGITGHDVNLVLFMVGEAGQNHQRTRPDLTQRYLTLILDGLRAGPQHGDLGAPMDDTDLDRFMQGWGPAPRWRQRP